MRADQIQCVGRQRDDIDCFAPIVADAEAGFGGVLNAFELMKAMIEAGAAGVHFEDQLASVKKCGHMGGKVLVPTQEAVQKLIAARLAADVMGVPTVLLARTDAEAADLVTTDVDENDKPFLTGERTAEGFYRTQARASTRRSRAASPTPTYADMVWCETGKPDLDFAQGIRRGDPREVPRQAARLQLLAVVQLEEEPRRRDHRQVPARAGRDGLQVPVHHAGRLPRLNYSMFDLAHGYARNSMTRLRRAAGGGVRRRREGLHRGQAPARGRHRLLRRGHAGRSSAASPRPTALNGSTEDEQFFDRRKSRSSPRRRFRRRGRARDPRGLRQTLPPVPAGGGGRAARCTSAPPGASCRRSRASASRCTTGASRKRSPTLQQRFPEAERDESLWPEIKLAYIGLLLRAPPARVRRDLLQLGRLPRAAPRATTTTTTSSGGRRSPPSTSNGKRRATAATTRWARPARRRCAKSLTSFDLKNPWEDLERDLRSVVRGDARALPAGRARAAQPPGPGALARCSSGTRPPTSSAA